MTKKCCDQEEEPKFKSDQERLLEICKALGNKTRAKIFHILLKKGRCISGDLADEFPEAHSTVSEHLAYLKKAGLVQGNTEGKNRCYCINPKGLKTFKRLVIAL
jgi:DNA-binding transcriptional ArsR family regulator